MGDCVLDEGLLRGGIAGVELLKDQIGPRLEEALAALQAEETAGLQKMLTGGVF